MEPKEEELSNDVYIIKFVKAKLRLERDTRWVGNICEMFQTLSVPVLHWIGCSRSVAVGVVIQVVSVLGHADALPASLCLFFSRFCPISVH